MNVSRNFWSRLACYGRLNCFTDKVTKNLRKEGPLDSLDLAHKVVELASDRQASDVKLLDVRGIASFADYFVILTTLSARQSESVVDQIVKYLKEREVSLMHREGDNNSGWILMDFGDIIIHVFAAEERVFYRLEELWSEAPTLVTIQ